MFIKRMNIFDLTINQLKRAVAIKEQIERLNRDLASILGGSAKSGEAPKKQRTIKAAAKAKKNTVSAATRAKLSAKLKAYWAAKRAGKK